MYYSILSGTQKIAYRLNQPLNGLPPLVLLHGFCEDHTVWDQWPVEAPGMSVLQIDLPGFGQSDPPASPGMDQYAHAVKAVLDALNISRCVLVGHSMGGYSALAFAGLYPERLCGMGLFHSHPFADTDEQQENRRRGLEMIDGGKKDLYVAQLFPKLFSVEYAEKMPETLNALIQNGQLQSPEGIKLALAGMQQRPDSSEVLKRLPVPVLIIAGRHDALIPYAGLMEVATLPTQCDLHLLTGAAHMGMFEAREMTAQMTRRFWQRCVH